MQLQAWHTQAPVCRAIEHSPGKAEFQEQRISLCMIDTLHTALHACGVSSRRRPAAPASRTAATPRTPRPSAGWLHTSGSVAGRHSGYEATLAAKAAGNRRQSHPDAAQCRNPDLRTCNRSPPPSAMDTAPPDMPSSPLCPHLPAGSVCWRLPLAASLLEAPAGTGQRCCAAGCQKPASCGPAAPPTEASQLQRMHGLQVAA